jgi:hypothetical protein
MKTAITWELFDKHVTEELFAAELSMRSVPTLYSEDTSRVDSQSWINPLKPSDYYIYHPL